MAAKPKNPPGVQSKNGRYYRVQYIGMVDGKRRYKWHPLTRVSDGVPALYRALSELGAQPVRHDTAVPKRITLWLQSALPGLSASEQKELARKGGIVSKVFSEFDTSQVQAKHVLQFLQQWSKAGKLRMAQSYRAMLNQFFKWVIVQGDRTDNPVEPVSTKAPQRNTVYMPHDAFTLIREKLMGNAGHACASGPMMQCYVDLLYLTGQRAKDIYSLRWSDIDEAAGVIHFQPTKTARSTGAKVDIKITQAIAAVLARAREVAKGKSRISPWVIHTLRGEQYKAHGLNSAWSDARKRAGIKTELGYTLKNIRPKHATDAAKAGYSDEQIQQGLAHAEVGMTREYIKQREATVGVVELEIPKGIDILPSLKDGVFRARPDK